jgi:SAM-dependent methyltransferase
MRWRRALLGVHVVRQGMRAPRDRSVRWDRYWARVARTGDGGDVLWDAGGSAEADRYLALLVEHAPPGRPVVDVGCGNGRFTRALAARFPAVGVDVSEHAVARARAESAGVAGTEFRVLDLAEPGVGRRLRAELGECAVFVRGVFHVMGAAQRSRLAAGIAELVGPGGVVLLAETNHPGPLLGYLESLGAGPRGLPAPLARAISAGLPRPAPFGRAELAAAFPEQRWERILVDDAAEIATIPTHRPGVRESVPALVAVLRAR